MNPYRGSDFFQFAKLLISRLFLSTPLAPDEIQFFVLSLVAIASSIVGTLLVLKKMTMLANSLSHTILLGIVIAYLLLSRQMGGLQIDFRILLLATLISSIITSLFTDFFRKTLRLQEDASIGLVFSSLFALGVILVTLFTRNAHIGLEIVMGNPDALHFDDLKLAALVAGLNALLLLLFAKEWKIICFDSNLANSLGMKPRFFHLLLMIMTSSTAICAFRAVGVFVFLSLLVGPPIIARRWSSDLKKIFPLSCAIGIACSFLAVATARHILTIYNLSLSTGGLVSLYIALFFALSLIPLPRRLTFLKISS